MGNSTYESKYSVESIPILRMSCKISKLYSPICLIQRNYNLYRSSCCQFDQVIVEKKIRVYLLFTTDSFSLLFNYYFFSFHLMENYNQEFLNATCHWKSYFVIYQIICDKEFRLLIKSISIDVNFIISKVPTIIFHDDQKCIFIVEIEFQLFQSQMMINVNEIMVQ